MITAPDFLKTGIAPTGSGGSGGSVIAGGNTIIVDITGDASSYTTITAGMAAAVAGDVVRVFPGTYTDKNITGNNVTLDFLPGTSLISTAATGTDACFKFDASHVFSIAGDGHFRIVNPSASNGDIDSPCVFNVAGGVVISVECGLIEGYQTDGSKVGQHFIACFDTTNGNSLAISCSNVGGNITVGSIDGSTNTLGAFGLFFCKSGTGSVVSTFFLIATGSIAALYDGNKLSSNPQFIQTLQVQAFQAIFIKQRVAYCSSSSSFYKSTNIFISTVTGNYKCNSFNADYLNIFCDLISGFNIPCLFSLDSNFGTNGASINAVIVTSNTPNGFNIDTSSDSSVNSSVLLDIPYIISTAVVKLYGAAKIRSAIWFTNGLGFDAGSSTGAIFLGYTSVDVGFSQGTVPIGSGIMEINSNVV